MGVSPGDPSVCLILGIFCVSFCMHWPFTIRERNMGTVFLSISWVVPESQRLRDFHCLSRREDVFLGPTSMQWCMVKFVSDLLVNRYHLDTKVSLVVQSLTSCWYMDLLFEPGTESLCRCPGPSFQYIILLSWSLWPIS